MTKARMDRRRWLKATVTLLAACLMFAGPTYLLFILQRLEVQQPLLAIFAVISFAAGAVLTSSLLEEKAP
jgi:hypothetical protein